MSFLLIFFISSLGHLCWPYDTCSIGWYLLFSLFNYLLSSWHNYSISAYWSTIDSTGCCGHGIVTSWHRLRWPTDRIVYVWCCPLRILVTNTILHIIWITVILVTHSLAFDDRHDWILCLFWWIEGEVAGGIVDPLYSKMWVDIEKVSDFFIVHINDSKHIPTTSFNFYCTWLQIRCLSFLEKFYK